MHISCTMCWMWAFFCWLGWAPTEPFNETHLICTRWVRASVRACVCRLVYASVSKCHVYIFQCLSPASVLLQPESRHLLQQTHVTWDTNTVEKVVYAVRVVTNRSGDSHHWHVLYAPQTLIFLKTRQGLVAYTIKFQYQSRCYQNKFSCKVL